MTAESDKAFRFALLASLVKEVEYMELKEVPLFMTPAQLSKLTGEHEGSIRRGIRGKRIPADKVNGRWMICRDKVFRSLVEGGSNEPNTPAAWKATS